MTKVYIALGSNLGNRINNLRLAVMQLKKVLSTLKASIIIETEAILLDSMPEDWRRNYLNMVISGDTNLSPIELLLRLKSIERQLGRDEFYEKWAPRIIDLDILLYGNEVVQSENLTIPHKELKNRPFLHHLLALLGLDSFVLHNDCFIRSFIMFPTIMGVVNVTNDSFSDGGKYSEADDAVKHSLKLLKDGATILDIGAQSTRPGALLKSPNDEIKVLKSIINQLSEVDISIDTFRPEVVEWVLKNYKIYMINDVSGSLDSRSLSLIRNARAKICVMHSLTVPADSSITLTVDCDPIEEILLWGKKKIDQLLKIGFNLEDIIIDPGIGFGKTYPQNIAIMRRVSELKELGVEILLGHSRKSYISQFSKTLPADRDIETIAISNLVAKDIDYLRVHDVSNHMKALVAKQSIVNL